MPELLVHVIEARNLPLNGGIPDPYPYIRVHGSKAKGKTMNATPNPHWNQFYLISFNSPTPGSDFVNISIMDRRRLGKDKCLGTARIPMEIIPRAVEHQSWYKLEAPHYAGQLTASEVLIGLSGVDFGMATEKPAQGVPPFYAEMGNEQRDFYAGSPNYAYPNSPQHYPPPPTAGAPPVYVYQTPYGACSGATYVIDESTLDPKTRKKIRRRRRFYKVLRITGVVCMVLMTAIMGVFLIGFLV